MTPHPTHVYEGRFKARDVWLCMGMRTHRGGSCIWEIPKAHPQSSPSRYECLRLGRSRPGDRVRTDRLVSKSPRGNRSTQNGGWRTPPTFCLNPRCPPKLTSSRRREMPFLQRKNLLRRTRSTRTRSSTTTRTRFCIRTVLPAALT